jgi:hypothetical protein
MGMSGDWIPETAIWITDTAQRLFPDLRKCVKILELDTHFVRLRIGKPNTGRPALNLASLIRTGGVRQCRDRGRQFKQGEMYHAF